MKPSLLRRHLQTKHANLKNKPQEFFEQELRRLLSSNTCIATDTINRNGLEAFHMVSYRVARTGKPHTIVEDFFLPAAADIAGTMLLPTPLGYTAASIERLLLLDSLKDVLDTTVKMVNFVKARPLNSHEFSALCNDMGIDHVTLLQHAEVRWLSRGKVLTVFKN